MNGTDTKTPPRYAPDAVATNLGWMNPRTGELLVSATNLDNPIDLRGYPRREYVFAIHAALRERAQVQDTTPEPEVQVEEVKPETPASVKKESKKKATKKKAVKKTTKKPTKKTSAVVNKEKTSQ